MPGPHLLGSNLPLKDYLGPNLPHQHFQVAKFAGDRYAGAQFASKFPEGPNLPRTHSDLWFSGHGEPMRVEACLKTKRDKTDSV